MSRRVWIVAGLVLTALITMSPALAKPPAQTPTARASRRRSCPKAPGRGGASQAKRHQICKESRRSSRRKRDRHKKRVRSSARIANTFGTSIFGIAAGGDLQQESPGTLAADLTEDRRAGARWLRIDINWASIQMNGPSSYLWQATDRVVRGAERRGMRILGVILYTPSWARPPGTSPIYPPNPASYAAFAASAVRHYSALGVHAYEVWNEPNTSGFWQLGASPAAYTLLLRAAYVAIKRSDPSATVVTGGMAPARTGGGDYSPVDFLAGIYDYGGKGYFDAVGQHPYCWPAFPGAPDGWSAWFQMYGTSPSLRSVMVAHGDGDKKIWATEFGAPTDGPPGTFVSDAKQAAMLRRAYQLFARYSWAGPLFFYQGRDQGTDPAVTDDFFGFLNYNFSPKPAFAAYRRVAKRL